MDRNASPSRPGCRSFPCSRFGARRHLVLPGATPSEGRVALEGSTLKSRVVRVSRAAGVKRGHRRVRSREIAAAVVSRSRLRGAQLPMVIVPPDAANGSA